MSRHHDGSAARLGGARGGPVVAAARLCRGRQRCGSATAAGRCGRCRGTCRRRRRRRRRPRRGCPGCWRRTRSGRCVGGGGVKCEGAGGARASGPSRACLYVCVCVCVPARAVLARVRVSMGSCSWGPRPVARAAAPAAVITGTREAMEALAARLYPPPYSATRACRPATAAPAAPRAERAGRGGDGRGPDASAQGSLRHT